MEFVTPDLDLRKCLIGDLDAGWVGFCVQFGMDPESGGGGRRGDEADNGFKTAQRFPAPVLADEGKEPVLDLVPLAGARREMADNDSQACFVGQFLQLEFPKPEPGAIAASRVSRDE